LDKVTGDHAPRTGQLHRSGPRGPDQPLHRHSSRPAQQHVARDAHM